MLSVMIRDDYGHETIHGNVRDVLMIPGGAICKAGQNPPGIHIRFYSGDGISMGWSGSTEVTAANPYRAEVFVMNESGKTVARYPL